MSSDARTSLSHGRRAVRSGARLVLMDGLRFRTHDALELEFYIPAVVWNDRATQTFLKAIYRTVEGATLIGGAKGAWKGKTEMTHLVRIVVRKPRSDSRGLVAMIREKAARMMAAWNRSRKTAQEAFLFTQRSLTVSE